MKKIGIVNSGGDCAGLNTVIASIVKAGVRTGHEFVGFEKGWEGILDLDYRQLDLNAVRGISHIGGTILKTTTHGRFAGKKTTEDGAWKIPTDILQLAKDNLEKIGIDGLIVIGGDGTLSAAQELYEFGVPTVGVPKTVDNDLACNDRTFGFSTAVDVAVEALDKIHTTASSHDRVFIVELMGRHAGWITLYAGLAANANAILLPEFGLDVPGLVDFVRMRQQVRGSTIIVVSEGLNMGQEVRVGGVGTSEKRLSGAAVALELLIEQSAPGEFEIRTVVLGHTQRGGSPNAEDRLLSKQYGLAAFEAFDAGQFGTMVCLQNGVVQSVPISAAVRTLKLVTNDTSEVHTAKRLGVYVNY